MKAIFRSVGNKFRNVGTRVSGTFSDLKTWWKNRKKSPAKGRSKSTPPPAAQEPKGAGSGARVRIIFWFVISMIFVSVLLLFLWAFSSVLWLWISMTLISYACLAYLGFKLYRWLLEREIVITKLRTGYARIVEKFGQYSFMLWSMAGFVEVQTSRTPHPMLVPFNHLHDASAAHDSSNEDSSGTLRTESSTATKAREAARNANRDKPTIVKDPGHVFRIGDQVTVKVDRTRRLPKSEIRVSARLADDPEKTVTVILTMDQVFLSRNFNFIETYTPEDYSLQQLYDLVYKKSDPSKPYPRDFFARIDKGFYFKACSAKPEKGENVQVLGGDLGYDDVIVKVNDPMYLPSTITNVHHGGRQLVGGLCLLGWPWNQVVEYNQVWTSLDASGKPITTDTKDPNGPTKGKPLKDILLKYDNYLVAILGAEDSSFLPLDVLLLIKLRVSIPFLAIYNTEKFLENITAIAGALYRKLIARHSFETIKGERTTTLGGTWWKTLQLEICDFEGGESALFRYGVDVASVEIWKVDVHGDENYKNELQRIQAEVFKAEQVKRAAIIKAEGEAKAVEIFFSKVRENGSDGLQILFMQTLQALGQKEGKMIIPFGNLLSFLQGTITPTDEQSLIKSLMAKGITVETIIEQMNALSDQKKAEAEEARKKREASKAAGSSDSTPDKGGK